ncbi:BppU family phage baseplate upper protein [Staphylococcus haemolyticus]|uniref:BppU family phage baseplate upper protein n=1 Tax=Staphylococcus haemolyticus TaxID=1283 RepID=UPI0028A4D8E7|nr:BppU family phage baseplate upper protein [Staphylococcus haemolyticus]MDT4196681.1 BppU family phage baseplate upper protein [Staphylococcus haemolyticus]MDT4206912.1 BppU family phage baseplate upper protein [Staphylococcus haemolyticus]MDT4245355.1 BppU family phage baseplate upper protein [Staphylococcus haemolyticus]MDT4260058.1 BppU family phage baseplate upper protein [Staphylococcus haemolyticus]MDT4274818.1 BppU family phage baseplate upper protein [Staphylococcus haemolyticus]
MELEKVAKIDLEEEAYLKPISDRGIGFYNLDKNTAQFQFRVTKDNLPLLISTNNVKGYAFFKQITVKNGDRPSTSGVLDVEFIDPMTGLIGVTVPPWFLKSVTNSTVLGEVYLSLNDYKNEDKDDTVVLGTFQFEVKDSLVNQISSDVKVSYIRMFDDLRDELEKKVEQLKKDIGSTQSLIDTIKQLSTSATQAIQKAKDDSINSINTNKTDALNNIEEQTTLSLAQIDSKKNDVQSGFEIAKTAFQNSVDQNTQTFDAKVTDANNLIDKKVNDFQTNGALTKSDVDNLMGSYDWQKVALTQDNGATISVRDLDFDNPTQITKSGFYYLYNPTNGPINKNGMLIVSYASDSYMKFIYTPFSSNDMYIRTKAGEWLPWQSINDFKDTGWINLPLVNGAYANTEYTDRNGYPCSYRIVTQNGVTTNHLRINASNLFSGQIFARLPQDMVKNAQSFSVRTPIGKPGCFLVINPTGDVLFYKSSVTGDWTEKDYIYAQVSWIN